MDNNTKSAIVGGTFFSSIMNIGVEDITNTFILAIIGAITSYIASLLIKRIHKRLQRILKR
jgi:spore maturation protein SpmA